ncbi:MAG: DMT family transporter, partial [Pseudomonadota bacterium]
LAVENTSVANVVFIFASMPVFAAAFSRVFLGEPVSTRMVLTMVAVISGLAVIAYGSRSSTLASWRGDVWALYVSAAFAAALTVARQARATSLVPTLPFAYIGAAVLLGLVVSPVSAWQGQWHWILAHGACIGAASCLLALGPRYISSAEVALLVLLESVLAPVLVWWVIGEDPGSFALVGGAIVIGALLVSNGVHLLELRRQRRTERFSDRAD